VVESRPVQPIYALDHLRQSSLHELAAMLAVRDAVAARHPAAVGLLRPTQLYLVSEIPVLEEVTARYRSLSSRFRLGGQFEWLPRLAATSGMTGLELAIERNEYRPRDPVFAYLGRWLVERGGALELDERVPDADLLLFRHFRFPLYHQTKRQMLDASRRHGFCDILLRSWFCHRPRRGKPCGTCHPCIDAMEEGFAFRVPAASRARYHAYAAKRALKRLLRRAGAARLPRMGN